MGWLRHLTFLLYITQSQAIARRYFVVNGFDGAMTLLGLLTGFLAGGGVTPSIAVSACLGTAIALGASGISSAYLSESAERRKALHDLEAAMVARLRDSAHGQAARLVPFVIAVVNGLAPLLIAMFITLPLWLAERELVVVTNPLLVSIGLTLAVIFLLGTFLGQIARVSWLWSGVRAVLIAVVTGLLILALR